MEKSFEQYAELAEQHLFNVPSDDDDVQWGQAWATLALAAAVKELAEAQRSS